MSVAKHHQLRITLGLTPIDEYMVAILYEEGEVKTSYFEHVGIAFDIKHAVKRLFGKGLIRIRQDKKRNMLSLTDYGREYIQQVEGIYAGRNDSK
jgi:predicted transcriptional regulator